MKHFRMKHRQHMRTWDTRGIQGRWFGSFPLLSLHQREERYCNTGTLLEDRSRNENSIILQKGETKIWHSDIPRCIVHQRVKNRHVFITSWSLPLSLLCSCLLQQLDCELSMPRYFLKRGRFPPSCRGSGTHPTNLGKITPQGEKKVIGLLFIGRRKGTCIKKPHPGGCCRLLSSSDSGFAAVAKHCI